jgi:hypothetical protein
MSCSKECLLIAAIGGLLPTAAKMATVYTVNPATPMPEAGLYFGLLLFSAIGAALAYGLSENSVKQALLLGVCAPGIITNMVAGVQEGKGSVGPATALNYIEQIIPSAHAQATVGGYVAPASAPAAISPGGSPAAVGGSADSFPYQLFINPKLITTDSWIKGAAWGRLVFVDRENVSMADVPFSMSERTEHAIPRDAIAAYMYLGGKATKIEIPKGSNTMLDVRATSTQKNDFLWALGARRQPVISEVEVNVQAIK